jgi:hypothetical protein
MTTKDMPEAETLSRADRIAAAITEAIIAAHKDGGLLVVTINKSDTLEALAEVAARIGLQSKLANTAAKGDVFADEHAKMIGRKLKALRKSRDRVFAPGWL